MLQQNCDQTLAVRGGLESPPAVAFFLVRFDVPLPWVGGFDSNDLDTVVRRIRNVEILPVVDVLERPAVTVLDNLPLRSRSDQGWRRDIEGSPCTVPSGCFLRGIRSQGRTSCPYPKGQEQCSPSY